VAAWARGIATFLAALVALLGAAGVFSSFRAPRLRITFEHTQPWCRTEADGELWVRVAVENVGRRPVRDCVGRITALATDGRTRADLDPVQLRWAGVPLSRAFDPMDIRPGQREFLNVLRVRPGAPWHLVTFVMGHHRRQQLQPADDPHQRAVLHRHRVRHRRLRRYHRQDRSARLLVTGQMILDLIVLGVGAKVIVGAITRHGQQRPQDTGA
jgi:hypothetical protein